MNEAQKQMKGNVKILAANVIRLSQLLTRERENLPAAYLRDPGLREAYVTYFHPQNIHKIRVPLRELSLHPGGLLSKGKLRVLDLGSGPGPALLGVMEFFADRGLKPGLEFTAQDQVAENLQAAEEVIGSCRDRLGQIATLNTLRSGIEGVEHLLDKRFDIIIFSNVLNELFPQDKTRINKRVAILLGIVSRLLSPDGSCIIIEPALRETSRELLEVGDGVVGHGVHIYSPCLVNRKCPALANPKDWCHEDIPWEPPDLVKEIDTMTGLRKSSLKFSYLVLRKDAFSLSDACGKRAFRVVSEPLVSKGKMEFYICGPAGRRLIARLDKDGTSVNQPFEKLHRGDVVGFEQLIDEGKRYKVGKETVVQDALMEKRRS